MFNKQMFTQFLLDKSQSGQQYWCNVISIEIGIFHTIYIFKKMLWVELRTDPNVYHVSVSLYRLTGLNFQLHLKTKSNINTSSKQTKQNINVTIKACWITASDFKSALKGAAEKTVYSAVQSTELLHTASVCSLKAGSWSISILMWVRCCSSNSWLISNFPVTSAKSKVCCKKSQAPVSFKYFLFANRWQQTKCSLHVRSFKTTDPNEGFQLKVFHHFFPSYDSFHPLNKPPAGG